MINDQEVRKTVESLKASGELRQTGNSWSLHFKEPIDGLNVGNTFETAESAAQAFIAARQGQAPGLKAVA